MNIRSWILKHSPTSPMVRGVGILAGTQALAQGLAILASPIITRLYAPSEFGLLATYMAIVSIITVAGSLRYELAIALPKSDTEAFHIAVLAICLSTIVSLVCLAVVLQFKTLASQQLNAPLLENYLLLVPISVFLVGFYNSCRYWAIRQDRYTIIGKTRLTQVSGSLLVQIGGSGLGSVSLFLGQLASQLLGVVTLARIMITRTSIRSLNLATIRSVLVRYKRFPIYSTWSALLNTVSTELPALFLAFSFGPAAAGFYALASRILRAPVTIIAGSIANVFLSGAAKAHRNGGLPALTTKVYSNLVAVAMPLMTLLAVIAPNLFSLVFSDTWYESGIYARWMTLWIFLVFVTSPLHLLFSVLERQDHEIIYQLTLFSSRIAALAIGVSLGGPILCIALFCIASSVCQVGFLVWVNLQLKISFSDIVLPMVSASRWSALVCAPALFYYFLPQGAVIFLACLLISCALLSYCIFLSLKRVAP